MFESCRAHSPGEDPPAFAGMTIFAGSSVEA